MHAIKEPASGSPLARLVEAVGRRAEALTSDELRAYVGSDLPAVERVLSHIQAEGLARGPVFCEWGRGLGGVCGVATLNGFTSLGIEIQPRLVEAARSLATDLGLPMVFAAGTFLLPGDADLAATATSRTRSSFANDAWDELDLTPADCNVVFSYPWPGEEGFVDSVFSRHVAADTLLVTYHDRGRVLVQRKLAGRNKLLPLGWMLTGPPLASLPVAANTSNDRLELPPA
jgi:hypothetical protein